MNGYVENSRKSEFCKDIIVLVADALSVAFSATGLLCVWEKNLTAIGKS